MMLENSDTSFCLAFNSEEKLRKEWLRKVAQVMQVYWRSFYYIEKDPRNMENSYLQRKFSQQKKQLASS